MIHITLAGTDLHFDEASLHVSMTRNGTAWNWESDYIPVFSVMQKEIPFADASSVSPAGRLSVPVGLSDSSCVVTALPPVSVCLG